MKNNSGIHCRLLGTGRHGKELSNDHKKCWANFGKKYHTCIHTYNGTQILLGDDNFAKKKKEKEKRLFNFTITALTSNMSARVVRTGLVGYKRGDQNLVATNLSRTQLRNNGKMDSVCKLTGIEWIQHALDLQANFAMTIILGGNLVVEGPIKRD